MNRVAEVNRELRLRGISEKLVRGNGYYYFVGGDAANWYSSSVLVYRASDVSVQYFLDAWSELSGKPLPGYVITDQHIRDHYRDRDMMVQITTDGHIRFRANAPGPRDNRAWREGGYVGDYVVTDDGEVHKVR